MDRSRSTAAALTLAALLLAANCVTAVAAREPQAAAQGPSAGQVPAAAPGCLLLGGFRRMLRGSPFFLCGVAGLTCAYTNNYPGFKVSVSQTTASGKGKGGDEGGGDAGKGSSSAPPPSAPRTNATAQQQQPRPQPIIVNINNFNTQPNATGPGNATSTTTRAFVVPSGGQPVPQGGAPAGGAIPPQLGR